MHHFTPCSRSPAEVKIFDVFGSIFSLYAVDDFFTLRWTCVNWNGPTSFTMVMPRLWVVIEMRCNESTVYIYPQFKRQYFLQTIENSNLLTNFTRDFTNLLLKLKLVIDRDAKEFHFVLTRDNGSFTGQQRISLDPSKSSCMILWIISFHGLNSSFEFLSKKANSSVFVLSFSFLFKIFIWKPVGSPICWVTIRLQVDLFSSNSSSRSMTGVTGPIIIFLI